MKRGALAIGLGIGLAMLSAARARAEEPPAGSIPLPVDKTATVRAEGKVYYLDGAKVIPRTAEITVQLGVTIVGINKASLDVQGGFKVHGTQDSWVTIRNVDFSPTLSPLRGVHLDMADLHGCVFRHPESAAFDGQWTIENSCLQRDCAFDVRIAGGFLKIMTVEFGIPCKIRCVPPKTGGPPIEVDVRSSWMKTLDFTGPAAVNFVNSEIRGLALHGVTDATVNGCDVLGELSVKQAAEDSFKKLVLTKVNFFDGCRLVLERPKGPDTKDEKLKLDKPFFGTKESGIGTEDEKTIMGMIVDGADAPEVSIKAWLANPQKRKHALVNYDTLRSRAPPLK
jgi:hypothetical protein